jgi:hypothetical protein
LVSPAGRLAAPPELAQFVSEYFYSPLGTRIYAKTLYEERREVLEAYRAAKIVLLDEIRSTVVRHRDSDPATRRQALQVLDRAQAPKSPNLRKRRRSCGAASSPPTTIGPQDAHGTSSIRRKAAFQPWKSRW